MEFEVGQKVDIISKTQGKHLYSNKRLYLSKRKNRTTSFLKQNGYLIILRKTSYNVYSCGDPAKGVGDFFHENDLFLYGIKEGKQYLLNYE